MSRLLLKRIGGQSPAASGGSSRANHRPCLKSSGGNADNARMLRRILLGQAIVVTAVVAGLTATHFVLNKVHPEATNLLFVLGLVVALCVLLASVGVIGRGISRMVTELEVSHLGTVTSLAAAIDASDGYTGEHSDAVRDLVVAVGLVMGLEATGISELEMVATLHDVGKIGIPKEVLHKPGPLNDEEWEIMRQHPEIGARILAGVPRIERLREAVLHEHEHWDGSGYPHGLVGLAIPLYSRIVLACDAYHAMTSDRPYRDAMSPDDARARMAEAAGTDFDPAVVRALLTSLPPAPTRSALVPVG